MQRFVPHKRSSIKFNLRALEEMQRLVLHKRSLIIIDYALAEN